MKYTITIITDMPDLDARALITDHTRDIAEGFDYHGTFTTTITASAYEMAATDADGVTVGTVTPFSAFMLTPAESSDEDDDITPTLPGESFDDWLWKDYQRRNPDAVKCVVVPGVDGPTLWDCTCAECVALQQDADVNCPVCGGTGYFLDSEQEEVDCKACGGGGIR